MSPQRELGGAAVASTRHIVFKIQQREVCGNIKSHLDNRDAERQ